MDPSTWMDPYSQLRMQQQQRNIQMNSSCSQQLNTNANLQLTAVATNQNACQRNHSINAKQIDKHQQQQHSQYLMGQFNNNNQHSQNAFVHQYCAQNDLNYSESQQGIMNEHYRSSSDCSWFFNSCHNNRNNGHDNCSQAMMNHNYDNMNLSSFSQSNPFATNSSHNSGVFDASFVSSSYNQSHQSNRTSITNSDISVDQIKKQNHNSSSYINGNYCCSTTKLMSMNTNDRCDNYKGNKWTTATMNEIFPPHCLTTNNGWSNQDYIASDAMARYREKSSTSNDQINKFNHCYHNGNNHSYNCNHSQINYNRQQQLRNTNNNTNIQNKYEQSNLVKFNSRTDGDQIGMSDRIENPNEFFSEHQRYSKNINSLSSSLSDISSLRSNPSHPYLMQNFSQMNRNNQNFVDQSIGAKFAAAAAAHHHHDPYASFALAAAFNSEYASFHHTNNQQNNKIYHNHATHHSHYDLNSINNYHDSQNHCNNESSCLSADTHSYQPSVANNHNNIAINGKQNRHNNLMNYYSNPLFPMTDVSINVSATAFKSNNSFLDEFSYPISSDETLPKSCQPHQSTMSLVSSNTQSSSTTNQKVTTAKSKSKKSISKKSVANVNNAFVNGYQTNCQTANNSLRNGNCHLIDSNKNHSKTNNTNSNKSQCSSVTSLQSQNHNHSSTTNDSYSYNYPSPIATNHSPYQQRSSTSNSSHSSVNSCILSANGSNVPDYMNYGTPNSAPPTVFQTIDASQTPTPTPGYPTPPSSVGHSNSRCSNSNEELSPYSNNSMSSNISHQSFGRNEYTNKSIGSVSSSSSQISPKQRSDGSISENLPQFSSCMMSTVISSVPKTTNQQNSPNVYATNVIDNDAGYDSPQYFSETIANTIEELRDVSPDSCPTGYSLKPDPLSAAQSNQDHKLTISDSCSIMDPATISDSYNFPSYSETAEKNAFVTSQSYPNEKNQLEDCLERQQIKLPISPQSHKSISQISQSMKNDFQDNSTSESQDGNDFDFTPVIQPIIEVNGLSEQTKITQVQTEITLKKQSSDLDMLSIENPTPKGSPFTQQSSANSSEFGDCHHDELNRQSAIIKTNDEVYTSEITTSQSLESSINFVNESSRDNDQLLIESTVIECGNLDSLMESLPKTRKNDSVIVEDDVELLPTIVPNPSDNFLQDLAPLMNDNSKIALMESTFKSNHQIESINTATSTPTNNDSFEKIAKIQLFEDDIVKIENQINFSKNEDVENHFRDVDEFLKVNFKDSPAIEQSIMNEAKSDNDETPWPIANSLIAIAGLDSLTSTSNKIENDLSNQSHQPVQKTFEEHLENSVGLDGSKKKSSSKKKCLFNKTEKNHRKTFKRKVEDFKSETVKMKKLKKNIDKNMVTGSLKPSTLKVDKNDSNSSKNTKKLHQNKSLKANNNNHSNHQSNSSLKKSKNSANLLEKPLLSLVKDLKTIAFSSSKIPGEISNKFNKKSLSTKTNSLKSENKSIGSNKKIKKSPDSAVSKISIEKSSLDKQQIKSNEKKITISNPSLSSEMATFHSTKIKRNSDKEKLSENSAKLLNNSANVDKALAEKSMSISLSKTSVSVTPSPPKIVPKPKTSSSITFSQKNHKTSSKKSKNDLNKSTKESEIKISCEKSRPTQSSLQSSALTKNPPLLSPNLMPTTCLGKTQLSPSTTSVNPGPTLTTNVTPTLIVNQSHPVNPYQVQPMTNAVLLTIHPANTTPIPSLTAQSFITLNTQSVTTSSTTTCNTTTAGSNTNQNSSRRRSQDKKVSTIREGLMRTGDFVVSEEESQLELPVIWRIEGKSLLQRFEPSEQQNGLTVYVNTSSYSAWNPTVRQKYLGLDVRIMGCNRTRIVVEKIGLTSTKKDSSDSSQKNKETVVATSVTSPSNIADHVENFEVLIQTLISQALDSNFIAEIIKDNDTYFLSHLQVIDDICMKHRTKFISKIKWDNVMLKNFETYPLIQMHKQNDVGDLRCRSCLDNWSTKLLYLEGDSYDRDTLEKQSIQKEDNDINKKIKIAACENCTKKITLYSKLYHSKYNLFLRCKAKVETIQNSDFTKESDEILESCLQDVDWMKKMFEELESILNSCDNIE
ncbi:Proline-rich protein 12 [Sarcoptes scabiei]|uniref:Glutamine and serine-rich protein 1 n=1 Tax=Sarcoptes scabiei TaxID=52283 RepID=A0A834R7U7_SARSC|nr:Proline-rich protein 12 [Sarcoptes scabiei]